MSDIVELGCIVCRNEGFGITPPEVHHIDGSKKEGCHFKTLPLCFFHHRSGGNIETHTSRHPYKKEFEKRYGTENELLNQVKELIK